MRLSSIELNGFKSFAKKTELNFSSAITAIVGPNGSGKSNTAEAFRFALGEQSMKSMRGRRGEDLLWNGSSALPRAGRASVRLVFNNTDRLLPLDFDEVVIERVVNRDGANEYRLNGSSVRLRDVSELLSAANIGASGHHIISQGEADRALSASSRERRTMVEDALGLTAYLYKRAEAERKLEKAAEHMREVESLRRELAPHLRFLHGQVKKIEDAQRLRDEFAERSLEYFKRESVYLKLTAELLIEEYRAPKQEHEQLAGRIVGLRAELARKRDTGASGLVQLEQESREVSEKREALSRELGRVEGELAARRHLPQTLAHMIPASDARQFAEHVERELKEAARFDAQELKKYLASLIHFVTEFKNRFALPDKKDNDKPQELENKKAELEKEIHHTRERERGIAEAIQNLRKSIEGEKDASRDAERELFAAMARRSELDAVLASLNARQQLIAQGEENFKRELAEAGVLAGRALLSWKSHDVYGPENELLSDAEIVDEPRNRQDDRRRKLERLRIRIEEVDMGGGAEVVKEHREVSERDQFLARELGDLESSATSLHQLIQELTATLDTRFSDGIAAVNIQFDSFFKIMFGGGSASLSIVTEKKAKRGRTEQGADDVDFEEEQEEDAEEGVEMAVTLPHKRIKGLHMLSGGERALTSIALIFALSQVNPPPFLILDETDAALDEANSRRYGDMIEALSKKSQLILITHNRETMSRAAILYGITMGADGASRLLSVKFEEALAVAK